MEISCPANVSIATINVQLASFSEELSPNTNESYAISVQPSPGGAPPAVTITAYTVFGMRHALETFAQLVGDDLASTSLTQVCSHFSVFLGCFPPSLRPAPFFGVCT